MDKPTIKQHTTPRAARQGGTAGASFIAVDLKTECNNPKGIIQVAMYGAAYGMGAARFARMVTTPKVKINTKAARRLMQAACKRYGILGTVTGRWTDGRNVQTLTKRPKRGQYL